MAAAASAPPAPAVQLPEDDVSGDRERLRRALLALAHSEAFLDILSKELTRAGLWQ